MFLVKGLDTTEIAGVQGSAEGTIKVHPNGIYRESGTRSRAEMLSILIDSLMAGEKGPFAPEPSARIHAFVDRFERFGIEQ